MQITPPHMHSTPFFSLAPSLRRLSWSWFAPSPLSSSSKHSFRSVPGSTNRHNIPASQSTFLQNVLVLALSSHPMAQARIEKMVTLFTDRLLFHRHNGANRPSRFAGIVREQTPFTNCPPKRILSENLTGNAHPDQRTKCSRDSLNIMFSDTVEINWTRDGLD